MADVGQGPPDDLGEGGGSGGGSEAVHEERQTTSAVRTVFGIISIIIAVGFIAFPVFWAAGFVATAHAVHWAWIVVLVVIGLAAGASGWALFKKSV